MYFLNHYVIDWEQVKTLEDIKRLLQKLDFAFEPTVDVESIKDLVQLVPKPSRDPLL